MEKIGITERGDAALHLNWIDWVRAGKPAILITKDPYSVYLNLVNEELPTHRVIVHSNITGWGGSKVEPNAPDPEDAIAGYHKLTIELGDRSVLRIDPIFTTPNGIRNALAVLKEAKVGYSRRVRISFIDMYPHVKERFLKAGIPNPYYNTFHAPLKDRQQVYKELCAATPATVEVCGEPDFECIGCVSAKDCELLGVTPEAGSSNQRKTCTCLGIKHELLKEHKRCHHGCLYCYWKD